MKRVRSHIKWTNGNRNKTKKAILNVLNTQKKSSDITVKIMRNTYALFVLSVIRKNAKMLMLFNNKKLKKLLINWSSKMMKFLKVWANLKTAITICFRLRIWMRIYIQMNFKKFCQTQEIFSNNFNNLIWWNKNLNHPKTSKILTRIYWKTRLIKNSLFNKYCRIKKWF